MSKELFNGAEKQGETMNLIVIGDTTNGKYYMKLCDTNGNVLNNDYCVSTDMIDESTGDADYSYIKRGFERTGHNINVVFVNDESLFM